MADEGSRAGTTSAARTRRKLPSPTSSRGSACVCSASVGNVARIRIDPLAFRAHSRVSVSDGTMIIFSSRIVVLRDGEDVPRSRRVHIATFRRPFGTVFHHAAAAALAVRTVPIPMIQPPVVASLVPEPSFSQAPTSRFGAASRRAISIASIAPRAEEEELTAASRTANHEPKRVHVPDRGTGENLFDRARS